MSVQPRCCQCRFWQEVEGPVHLGECRRWAPRGASLLRPPATKDGAYSLTALEGFWPQTKPGDWCGEVKVLDA